MVGPWSLWRWSTASCSNSECMILNVLESLLAGAPNDGSPGWSCFIRHDKVVLILSPGLTCQGFDSVDRCFALRD